MWLNKVRLINKHEVVEIETCVDFLTNSSNDEDEISLSSMKKNEKSEELI